MLILERAIAFIFLATLLVCVWRGETFTLPEFITAFVLCNIWIATIDMRKKDTDDN